MLYRLNAEVRGTLLLPLGEVADKAEVREIALNAGFACHNAPDSTENCFLPDSDYAAFLREKLGELPGDIISPQGEPAGRHTGVYNFTVGQRKGLGSFGKPVFVRGIDAASRRVYLGYGEDEFCSYALLENCVWHADSAGEVEVKIRSMAKPAAARVTPTEDGAHIDFDAPQRAVTPGQSAVIYRGGQVVGGGIIC